MIRLIVVEARRFLARRLLRVVTILVVAGFTFGGVMAFIASENSSEAMAAWRTEKATAIEECVRHTEAGIEAGLDEFPERASRDTRGFCEANTWVESPAFRYRDVNWMLMGFALPLMILSWLFGASFVGAEWHNRTMTTLLTWEPRRLRVLAGKAIATSVIVFLWVLASQAVALAVFYPAARFEGTMTGVDIDWWLDVGSTALRVSGLGCVVASFGLALATVGRNSAAALGIGFGYFAVVESLIRVFKPSWFDWLVGPNIALVLDGSEDIGLGHSQGAGGALLLAYVAISLVVAGLVFRRRDIA